ncbi:MAG: hypothetical protein IT292_05485 [Deltaproteobacteria bacterium]|nr:hypothetical protein [Deltaproteobacteria bacterium]
MRRIILITIISMFAFTIGHASAEPLAVIVNKQNPSSEYSRKDLARIYLGNLSRWPDGQKIVAIHQPGNSEVKNDFLRLVLSVNKDADYQKQIKEGFHYLEMDSDSTINRLVEEIPNAIAYMPLSKVDSRVKILVIDSYQPQQSGYPLQ